MTRAWRQSGTVLKGCILVWQKRHSTATHHLSSLKHKLKLQAVIFDYPVLAAASTSAPSPGRSRKPAAASAQPQPELHLDSRLQDMTLALQKARGALDLLDQPHGAGSIAQELDGADNAFSAMQNAIQANRARMEDMGPAVTPQMKYAQKIAQKTGRVETGPQEAAGNNWALGGKVDIKAKYMQRLLTKTGGRSQVTNDSKGDAGLLSAARTREQTQFNSLKLGLDQSAEELLKYVAGRGMALCLLAGSHTPLDDVELVERHVHNLHLNFATVALAFPSAGPMDPPSYTDSLQRVLQRLQVLPQQTLVLSSQPEVLRAARDACMFTGLVTSPVQPRTVPVDFHVEGLHDVRRHIEEINGISYR